MWTQCNHPYLLGVSDYDGSVTLESSIFNPLSYLSDLTYFSTIFLESWSGWKKVQSLDLEESTKNNRKETSLVNSINERRGFDELYLQSVRIQLLKCLV